MPLMIAHVDDRDDIVDILLKNWATASLKISQLKYMIVHFFSPLQYRLTIVYIVRRGKLNILKILLENAKDQQVYCSKKGKAALPLDCEAVLLTRAKKVNIFRRLWCSRCT